MKTKTEFTFNPLNIGLLFLAGVLFLFSLIWRFVGAQTKWSFLLAIVFLVAAVRIGEPTFFRTSWNTFKRSLKNMRLNLIVIIICDIAAILLVVGAIVLAAPVLQNKANDVEVQLSQLDQVVKTSDVQSAGATADSLWMLLILMFTIYVLLICWAILVFSTFKGIIWFLSNKMTPKVKDLIGFMLLNCFWIPITVTTLLLIAIALKDQVAQPLILLYTFLALHMTTVLNGSFVHVRRVWDSIGVMFKVAFKKARYFIIPYLLLGCIFYSVMFLSAAMGVVADRVVAAIMVVLILPLVLSVARIYLARVVKEQLP